MNPPIRGARAIAEAAGRKITVVFRIAQGDECELDLWPITSGEREALLERLAQLGDRDTPKTLALFTEDCIRVAAKIEYPDEGGLAGRLLTASGGSASPLAKAARAICGFGRVDAPEAVEAPDPTG